MKLLALSALFLLVSCATTMPGKETKTGSEKVSASVDTNSTFTNEQIQFYQYSIKNLTNKWIEFDGATIKGSDQVSVLVGDRISSWIEACTLEKNVADYNTAMFLGAVAVGGAVVAGASNHPQTSGAGAIIALGSISVLGVKDFQNSKNKVEFQRAFPKNHIFQPFSLPPGKVIQRWILVENPNAEGFVLNIKAKTGEELNFEVEAINKEEKAQKHQKKNTQGFGL